MTVTIESIKETVTIQEVLAEYGADIRGWRGSDWKPVVCPFCSDSGGSASANLRTQRFLCHQCDAPRGNGKSGDVIDVVMYGENFRDVKDAISWIEKTFM